MLGLLLVGFVQAAHAQGQLRVTVADEDGYPIPRAIVVLSGDSLTGGSMERETDDEGTLLFSDLPASSDYELRVVHDAFQRVTYRGVSIADERTTRVAVELPLAGPVCSFPMPVVDPLEARSATQGWLDHLPPEPWEAPTTQLFGGRLGPLAAGVDLQGVAVAAPGDRAPLLPRGTVSSEVHSAPLASGWAPGGARQDATARIDDELIQAGGPTPRAAASARPVDGRKVSLAAATDVDPTRQAALVQAGVGDTEVLASGGQVGDELDALLILDTWALGVDGTGSARAWTQDGALRHRATLDLSGSVVGGVDGGIQLERRGVGTAASHRAGASLEGQTRLLPFLRARAGVRADGQARGSVARVEPGGEVGLQLHTTSGRYETGVVVAGAHTARQLAPLSAQDVPSTDRLAVTPYQSLPDDWMLRGEGQLVRSEGGDVAALWSVGVDKWSSIVGYARFDVSLRLSGGARVVPSDGGGADWTEAVALAWWDPVGRLRLGAAARGQLGTPWVVAPDTSWLPDTDDPHVDAGSRIVQGVRLREGALELEAAGWVRAEPLGPARVEGALRYTW